MARKQETQRIPRPPNAFILYRSHKTGQLPPPPPGTYRKQGDISRMVSQLWHQESQEVKAEYQQLALIKKLEHEAKYPGYKYSPRSKGQRERERRERSNGTHSAANSVQADSCDVFHATGFLYPSTCAGPSEAHETTLPLWSQQEIEDAFKVLCENLGTSNHHVQPGAYAASYGSDAQPAIDPFLIGQNYTLPQAYGELEYVPSSHEVTFDSMLQEFTGGQLSHWHQV
ncbi:Mating-type M-specific polypeptide Mc [Termitomyces sp. T112]|nr:Mating-type M-specific polypeptide Mc [Termitomyces sp. T112]